MIDLYIGDRDEKEVLAWLIENIGPLDRTIQDKYEYYPKYYAKDNIWSMHTADVSDVSLQFDTITSVRFAHKEDALLTKVRWGGALS